MTLLWLRATSHSAGTSGDETTSVANATGCRQHLTTGSPLGTAMAVSPSYQINYGSLPFGAPGKLSGGTLQKQFAAVLAAQPSNVFISSFNEFIAQPQPNHFNSPYAFSFGMPWDTAGRDSLWVDTYGWGFGRDIEPRYCALHCHGCVHATSPISVVTVRPAWKAGQRSLTWWHRACVS